MNKNKLFHILEPYGTLDRAWYIFMQTYSPWSTLYTEKSSSIQDHSTRQIFDYFGFKISTMKYIVWANSFFKTFLVIQYNGGVFQKFFLSK